MTVRRRLIPDIACLQAFECAARHQNFSRAAGELALTQSAVSRQIRELELQTGLRLFERVRQRVVLSDSGRRLLPEVRDLLARSERLMIGAVAAGSTSAALRLATLPTFGAKWLMPRIGRFLAARPEVALTVESRASPFSFDDEGFDAAIHFGQPAWPGAVTHFLCNEAVIPVCAPSLPRRARLVAPQALTEMPLLHLTTRPRLWADWFAQQGVTADNPFPGARFDQFSMIVSAAIAGIGVALLPWYLIEDEVRAGGLLPLFDAAMQTENSYYVVVPEAKQANAVVAGFVDWLLAQDFRFMGAERGPA